MLTWALCVSTLNRIEVLCQCVRLAVTQTRPPAEVIVVDASDDWEANRGRVAAIVEDEAPGTRFVYREAPRRSLPAQRNAGIAEATADVLFLIDDDSLMYPDCAERIMALYEADAEGRIAGIQATDAPVSPLSGATQEGRKAPTLSKAPFVRRMLGRSRIARFLWAEVLMLSSDHGIIPYDREARQPGRLDPLPEDTREIRTMQGSRMTVRRRVAEREPFDDGLMAYATAEDMDASYRFSRHGVLLRANRAKLYHFEAAAARLKRRQVTLMHCMNIAYFLKRNSDRLGWHVLVYGVYILRRAFAELLKDLASGRLDLPQVRGVLRGGWYGMRVLAWDREGLTVRYRELQSGILAGR